MKNTMKYFITIIVSIISLLGISQKIENGVINYTILEAEIIKAINKHRKSIGADTLATSKVAYREMSSKVATLNANADLAYHPHHNCNNKVTNNFLYKEICRIEKKTPISIDVLMMTYGEIICKLDDYDPLTYQEFAVTCVKSWISSPPHKEIMELSFKNVDGFAGLIACSVKKSKTGKYYVIVDFVEVTYANW
jgi:hypothetical protein